MSWAQLMRNPRGTGRVYSRAEIRELEQKARADGYAKAREESSVEMQALTKAWREKDLLVEGIGQLEEKAAEAHEEGYLKALEETIKAVEATPSSTGRKQILAMLNEQLAARKGGE